VLFGVLQSVYMHTSISDPAILVVFELVAKSFDEDAKDDDDGEATNVGCGWGFISLFKRNSKCVDVSDAAASPAARYVGTFYMFAYVFHCLMFVFPEHSAHYGTSHCTQHLTLILVVFSIYRLPC